MDDFDRCNKQSPTEAFVCDLAPGHRGSHRAGLTAAWPQESRMKRKKKKKKPSKDAVQIPKSALEGRRASRAILMARMNALGTAKDKQWTAFQKASEAKVHRILDLITQEALNRILKVLDDADHAVSRADAAYKRAEESYHTKLLAGPTASTPHKED